MDIQKDQWDSYVRVQESGVTNMLDLETVSSLTGLTREEIMYIIKNYSKLFDLYGRNQ